jgi:transmembrane sensor
MREGEPSPSPSSRDAAIERAAGDWVARLDRGLTPDEAVQLAAWEAADPQHAAELARLNRTWHSLDTADEIPAVMEMAREVDEARARTVRFRRFRPWVVGAFAAAAAVVLVGIGQRPAAPSHPPASSALLPAARSYAVVPSSSQRLTLADGTEVVLNANSAVEPAFTRAERRVRVLRGEAHFNVMKDPDRPFLVQAGDVIVRAVGTSFNVRLAAAAVEILVTEGKVTVANATEGSLLLSGPNSEAGESLSPAVAAPLLIAGQRVVLAGTKPAAAAAVEVTASDIERALSWQGTQLIFERTTLEEAVAAFNSFNKCQLTLGDPRIRDRRLGGTFRADNLDAFVRLLETGFEVTAERRGVNEIVLRGAP